MAVIKVKTKPRPETNRLAVAPVYSKYSGYPSNGLDPRKLASIFREADQGDVYRQMELFEEMEEKDPHIFSQLQTRKNAVTGLDWEIIPYSDDEHDKQVAAFVDDQLSNLKNLETILMDLLDAIGKGISVSEILWGYEAGKVVIKDLIHIHSKLLHWDAQDTMRIETTEEPTGIPLTPNKFVVHQYKARSGHPSRAGVLRVCAWMYLFKNYSIKDWVAFAEVYGMPLRLGKYDANASEEDKTKLMQALIQLGTDAAGMIPNGSTIEFIESNKATSISVYETLARYCDEQTSKAIVGQTLTADSGGGSYAQSKTHAEVRHDLTAADCKALAATLKDDLIRPLVLFNFGHEDRLPTLHFACELPEDLKVLVEIFVALTGIGVPIPLTHIYSKFGIPTPVENEAVTSRASTSALLPFKDQLFTLKDTPLPPQLKRSSEYQARLDRLAEWCTKESSSAFAKSFDPIKRLINGTSLAEAQQMLDDPSKVKELLDQMHNPQLQQLLQDAMLAAHLAGRDRAHV